MKKLIAYCGLDCEKCDAFIATKNNDKELLEKTAALWSKLNGTEISPEQLYCEGCRMDGIKTTFCDNLCGVRTCASAKGFETCGACAELEKCPTVGEIISNNPDLKKNLLA